MWAQRNPSLCEDKWYHACLPPKLAVCAVSAQWRTFHFIIACPSCSSLHLSHHAADTRLLFTPRRGHSWHQIGKCAKKSQTRNIWHRSGHQILPHALMPPSETYIYLFITATHAPTPPPPSPNSGSYLKAGNMWAPSKCGNIWLERLWELSVSSSLDIFDLGLGPPVERVERGWFGWWGGIQMAEQRRDQSSTMHFFPPTSACKQMWFSSVIWFISVMWIPFDKKYHQ